MSEGFFRIIQPKDALEKGYKYLRREGTPGNYRYFYDDAQTEDQKEKILKLEKEFGPVYTQFEGKPKEGLDFLLEKRKGNVIAPITAKVPLINEEGKRVFDSHGKNVMVDVDIDFIWGDYNEKTERGHGFSKIIGKHTKGKNDKSLGDFKNEDEMKKKVLEILTSCKPKFDKDKIENIVFENEKREKVIVKRWKAFDGLGNNVYKHYIVTSFDGSLTVNEKRRNSNELRLSHDDLNPIWNQHSDSLMPQDLSDESDRVEDFLTPDQSQHKNTKSLSNMQPNEEKNLEKSQNNMNFFQNIKDGYFRVIQKPITMTENGMRYRKVENGWCTIANNRFSGILLVNLNQHREKGLRV